MLIGKALQLNLRSRIKLPAYTALKIAVKEFIWIVFRGICREEKELNILFSRIMTIADKSN